MRISPVQGIPHMEGVFSDDTQLIIHGKDGLHGDEYYSQGSPVL